MTLFASAQYTLLLLLHTLLLVYWLGLDLGIFYLGACLGKRELPAFTRTTLCQILITLDMVPRFCLIQTQAIQAKVPDSKHGVPQPVARSHNLDRIARADARADAQMRRCVPVAVLPSLPCTCP